jgi:hypothetical protein
MIVLNFRMTGKVLPALHLLKHTKNEEREREVRKISSKQVYDGLWRTTLACMSPLILLSSKHMGGPLLNYGMREPQVIGKKKKKDNVIRMGTPKRPKSIINHLQNVTIISEGGPQSLLNPHGQQ